MSANRFASIDEMHAHNEKVINDYNGKKITDFFACNVFNGNKVREYVSDEGYKSWQSSVKAGNKIDRKMAETEHQELMIKYRIQQDHSPEIDYWNKMLAEH